MRVEDLGLEALSTLLAVGLLALLVRQLARQSRTAMQVVGVEAGECQTLQAMQAAVDSILSPPLSPEPLRVEPQQAAAAALLGMADQVAETRARLQGEMPSWTPEAQLEGLAHLDDFTLLRFLQAQEKKGDVNAAVVMHRDAMAWRADVGLGRLFSELHPTQASTDRQRFVRAHFYSGCGGLSRDGTPYFCERLGRADLAGYSRSAAADALIKQAYLAHLETLTRLVRACSAASGRLVHGIIVVDAAGIGLSTVRNLGLVKYGARLGLLNFPEGTHRVLVVNAPRLVAAVWAIISPLLPEATRRKISIISHASTPATLLKYIAPEQLPTFLGGQRSEADSFVPRAEPLPYAAALRELSLFRQDGPADPGAGLPF